MTTHRLPIQTRIRHGLWMLLHVLPDAVDWLRAWYRDENNGRRIDTIAIAVILLGIVAGSALGLIWAFMRLAE